MTMMMVSVGRCQFCHRTDGDVGRILAGDSGFICDECVAACVKVLAPATDSEAADRADRYAFQRLIRHFAPRRAHEVYATLRTFPIRQQADLQLALDALFGELRVPENFVGIQVQSRHEAVGFSKLLEQTRGAIEIAPPQYEEIDIGRGETIRCLKKRPLVVARRRGTVRPRSLASRWLRGRPERDARSRDPTGGARRRSLHEGVRGLRAALVNAKLLSGSGSLPRTKLCVVWACAADSDT